VRNGTVAHRLTPHRESKMPRDLKQLVEDTYAEGFRSIYGEILVTARDDRWLRHAVTAATGHASSTILCDCEAGVAQWISAEEAAAEGTPDGRPGAVLQFHVPRFRKDRREHLERVLLARISQNVLTCPTARCFNRLDTEDYFKLGRKIALFGDRHQFRATRYGEKGWVIPILGGEFFLSRRFGWRDGVMGGNLWFFGESEATALDAAERAAEAAEATPDVITTFPGGVAASGSKAGSSYSFLIASTYAEYCPTLREKLGEQSRVPEGVRSIMEIIINGRDLEALKQATRAALHAAAETPDLVRISAGNYGGRLGKTFIPLHELID
jgi:formylmethanofuran--tetrahydromethanopterin N-formyltransferase